MHERVSTVLVCVHVPMGIFFTYLQCKRWCFCFKRNL